MKKIKVLVVDDSPLFRKFLVEGLAKYDFIDVVGYAVDAYDAMEKIKVLQPNVITSDIEMPKMDGITFVKKMMAEMPMRMIVVSSVNISVFDAISAGAIDFVRKPSGDKEADGQFMDDLADKILIASQARLRLVPNTQTSSSRTAPASKAAPAAPARPARAPEADTRKTAASVAAISKETTERLARISSGNAKPAARSASASGSKQPLIALGASTGGTEALLEVVKDLPSDTPGIVIVQHMPAGFTKMYADRLDRVCNMRCREAKNGDKIEQGLILIAPGDLQMSVVKSMGEYSVRCVPGNRVSGHRPSVDVLFDSVAKVASPNAIGAILTGMGADGAKGILAMKNAGCYTIGQDEETCVVYGMPMMAYNMGGITKQAPLEKIAGLIMSQLSKM